ncbi:TPA: hypothetical protein QDC51_003818 [Burkholderia multivorans]|uniref:hypothetical protein n=1 Tax=Burkholderia multivorans TaxID=87883 RepID=UPI001C231689|nr:hypothetical protein [Burkholderia multivorans]MBU9349608.1 hypothetical protein [Burkholderia multivorans]MBU9393171.1 hypothetical protein [Burkholderia multivorans]MBU9612413.1 hypothetical protein [Burkholderia multivorans]HDR9837000.1 hypothetical protein [Burkholderia multivorans]HDR9842858.1 hypothetical protein [Burkholderia multivorans]
MKPKQVYAYLDKRAQMMRRQKQTRMSPSFPQSSNSAGVARKLNPWPGIEYNPTRTRQCYVRQDEIDLAVEVARSRRSIREQQPSSADLILALRVKAAYLTVSRPTEMLGLHRPSVRPEGV